MSIFGALTAVLNARERKSAESARVGFATRRAGASQRMQRRAVKDTPLKLHTWLSRFPDFSNMTRQRMRRAELAFSFRQITEQYGGEPRCGRRRMALALMRRNWKPMPAETK